MTNEDVDKILAQKEGTIIEFKEAQDNVPASLYETIVSFANTDGGTILLGVNDEGNVLGLNDKQLEEYLTNITTSMNNRDCINPTFLQPVFRFRHVAGQILILQISASSQIHDHGGKIFLRQGDADIDITNNRNAIGDLHKKKEKFYTEAEIIKHLSLDDLNINLFDKSRQIIRGFRSTHPWVSASNDQILSDSLLYRTDFQTGEQGLTLAAALIFGKDITIQSILPAYKVEAMVRISNPDRYDDRITIRTNLIDTYLQLMEFIQRHLPEKFYMEDEQRKDLRSMIFREVIANIIVHREYRNGYSSELIINKKSVVLTNPNRPIFHGPLNLDRFNPYPKNPNIRRFFTALGWADEIGSGVRNTRKYLSFYIPGAVPLFIEDDLFRTEIPLVSLQMDVFASKFKHWLELPDEVFPLLEKGLRNIALDPSIAEAGWEDLLLHLVPTWHQQGAKLHELKWPDKQIFVKEEIEKVPSWSEKGANLLHKKIRYLLSILILTSNETGIEQLMAWLNYKKRQTFRENYMIPLQKAGLISMKKPDKPTDPEQQYKLTELGRLFLAGRMM